MILTLVQNLIPIMVVVIMVLTVVKARKQPLWSEAFRRLRRNPLAMISLVVITLYGTVAVLDSISWQDGRNEPRKSVIDRMFQKPKERTYSAPLAKVTIGEPKPHKLKSTHLIGTDGVGDDVFYLTLKGCRTALLLGGLTSIIVTPLALLYVS